MSKQKQSAPWLLVIKQRPWLWGGGAFVLLTVGVWLALLAIAPDLLRPFSWAMTRSEDTVVETPEVVPVVEEDEEEQDGLVPRSIDGVLVAQENSNPFPVAMMIDNIPPAWPHSGLEAASVLYETLVEGGATRIMAVFAGGEAAKIGPVRSARPYYLEWVSEYDALYGHVGGSPEALGAIDGMGIKDFSQFSNGQYFWRDQSRYAPHNVYTSSELIQRALRDRDFAEETPQYGSWLFKDDAPLEERPLKEESIEVHFSSGQTWVSEYVYDRVTNQYAKFHAGRPHIDAETGNQLQTKNVVVIIIPPILDYGEKGRLTLDVHGEGRAFIFRDGEKITGSWKKTDRLDRTRFYDENGSEVLLNRGTSWVSIVPEGNDVIYTESEMVEGE
ncbi:MAG: DUF3048 domain-containing protein [bacterium]|nr:DUF3048 domain-containing protein [bacterium]